MGPDKVLKGGTECLFCLRKLRKNICSLNSITCKRNSINEKLMSFISPADYKNVNDPHLFPDPKICSSCVNLVNSIHRNAVKIESLAGTRLNFHLDCGMAVEGNPVEKWPDVKQKYESNLEGSKTSSREKKECFTENNHRTKSAIVQQSNVTEAIAIHVSPRETNQGVHDHEDDTDNYCEGEESIKTHAFATINLIHSPNAPSHHTWSVKSRLASHLTQVPKLSLKLVKSNSNSMHAPTNIEHKDGIKNRLRKSMSGGCHTEESGPSISVYNTTRKTNGDEREMPREENRSSRRKFSTQNCQSNSFNTTMLTDSFGAKEATSKKEKDAKMTKDRRQTLLCSYADCAKAFVRPRDLKRHITLHTKEKSFKCEVPGCLKEYRSQNQLASHSQSHRDQHEDGLKPPDKTLPCEVCGKFFLSALNIRRHINLVHKSVKQKVSQEGPYICEVDGCSRVFRWKSCMVRHKALKHRKEDYKHNGKLVKYTCEVESCKEEFNRRSFLRKHMKSVHGKVAECGVPKTSREWLCPDCGMAVIKIQMSRHKDTYHGPGSMFNVGERGIFKCMAELCEKKFDTAKDLKSHISSHLDNPPFACLKDNCQKAFHLKKNLDLHMMIHDDIKPYQCNAGGCIKSYTTQLCLMRHSREHNDGLYVCPVDACKAAFRNMNNAGGHLASHRGEDPYVCGLCGATFKTYNVWSRHKKRHSGVQAEKRNKCSECGKCFALKSDLKRHLPVHSEHKPYTCEICGMGYASKGGYKGHMLTHEEKKYICKIEGCGKRFTLPLTFKRHQATHNKSNQLCSSCGKIIKFSLKKHKCPTLRQELDGKATQSDTNTQVSSVRKEHVQNQELSSHVPLPSLPLTIPTQDFHEYDQSFHLLQQSQSLHIIQEDQGSTSQRHITHQQFHQQPLHPQEIQNRQHHALYSFQSGLQLPVQQIQPLVMPHDITVPAVADAVCTGSGNVSRFDLDIGVATRQPQAMSSTTPMPNPPALNLPPNHSFSAHPPPISSVQFTPLPIAPTPVAPDPNSVPMTAFTSQPNLSLDSDSLTFAQESTTASLQNFITVSSFTDATTSGSLQPLSRSLTTALAKVHGDYY